MLAPDLRRAKLVAVIGAASYVAAGFGAWFLFIWPAAVALAIAIAGGLVAHSIARASSDEARSSAAALVMLVGIAGLCAAIGMAARAGGNIYVNPLPDVLTAAGVAPVVGVLFVLLTLDRGKTWSFAIIGVAAHASLGLVYGNGGGAIWIVGIVPALGIFLAAGSVAHGSYGGMPYSRPPFSGERRLRLPPLRRTWPAESASGAPKGLAQSYRRRLCRRL